MNKIIIRLGVPLTYDINSNANRVLNEEKYFVSVNSSNSCSVNLRHASNVKPSNNNQTSMLSQCCHNVLQGIVPLTATKVPSKQAQLAQTLG